MKLYNARRENLPEIREIRERLSVGDTLQIFGFENIRDLNRFRKIMDGPSFVASGEIHSPQYSFVKDYLSYIVRRVA